MAKNFKKSLALCLALCMCLSMLGTDIFASGSKDDSAYSCHEKAHTHSDECYTDKLVCEKHVHGEECYDENQQLVCGKDAALDCIAEEYSHSEACYHIHSGIDGDCYTLSCEVFPVVCEDTEHEHDAACNHIHGEGCYTLSCTIELTVPQCGKDEHSHGDACLHAHSEACYEAEMSCGYEAEHEHSDACVGPGYNYYTNPINENIDLTLYNYGSYINVGEEKSLLFGWHNSNTGSGNYLGRPYEGIDGPAMRTDGTVFTSWEKSDGIYYSNKIYNFPTVERTLNADGYPQIAAKQMVSSNKNTGEIVDVSLEYLFPKDGPALNTGAATNPLSSYSTLREEATFIEGSGYNSNYESMRFEMLGDGGLFTKDANGYYTYDSAYTSAYYDTDAGRFMLSETIIGPSHYGADYIYKAKSFAKNFLPFNKINFSNADQFYKLDDQWVYMTQYAEDGSVADDLADMWFGFDMEFDFYIPKDGQINGEDMIFDFTGDDDIWVYIDDVLVLDLAGCHGAVNSWINFATGEVYDYNIGYSNGSNRQLKTNLKQVFINALGEDYVNENMAGMFNENGAFVDYSGHTLKFFYTERGGNISYCKLKFNMPTLPSGSLSVGKQLEAYGSDTVPEFVTNALSYEFRVVKADENGEATTVPFIPEGTSYKIVSASDYENILGTGTVGKDGYFSLRDGQVALFEEVLKNHGNCEYIVEERIPSDLVGTYGEVEYVAGNISVATEVTDAEGNAEQYLTYYTPALSSDQTQKVTYTNKVKVDTAVPLTITKAVEGSTRGEMQEVYQINVLVGNSADTLEPLAVGTAYTVGETRKTVETAGIIELKADETAELKLLTGTCFEVSELCDSDYLYDDSYAIDGAACEGGCAIGSIAPDQTVGSEITVTNSYYSVYSVTYISEGKTLQFNDGHMTGDAITQYAGDTPEKSAGAYTIYTFSGWKLTEGTPDGDKIGTTDLVYEAQFRTIKIDKDDINNDIVNIPNDIPLAPVPEVFTDDHFAYIVGYPDGSVQPSGQITRAEVATIFFRLLDDTVRESFMTSENEFSDVNPGNWFNNAVSTMAAMGIVNGYPDGSFRPNAPITRAEFAAIAARFDLEATDDGNYFSDISGHWAESDICKAANNGWIKGYDDGTFRPNQNITRAEAMTLVNRVLHRLPETPEDLLDDMIKWPDNANTEAWYYLAVQEATNSHLYSRETEDSEFETWLEIREARDWTELEY